MSDHNLIYFNKAGKEFHGKTLIPGELISLLDPESGEKVQITKSFLTKNYKGSKDNLCKNKPVHSCPGSKRGRMKKLERVRTFEDYLNGVG